MMYATKTPSLRIDQSDLKCKNGCGFYGNDIWQGYCSKCHREQVYRQRKSERIESATTNVQREHQVLERQPKTSQIAGFSKFEEKKLRQSDSLKKKFLKKIRKSPNTKDAAPVEKEVRESSVPKQLISSSDMELQKAEFFDKFSKINPIIQKDTRKYIHYILSNTSKQCSMKTIDELSEIMQNFYQVFAKRMDECSLYNEVDAETKELLLDFVEKHSMAHLHSILFSPFYSDDEKKDVQIHSRIRQLCWVSPQHLDCRIDQANPVIRDLLYTAITELVGMDGVLSPGEKLQHVIGCCRGVVGVVSAASGGPASADELLPALIFTVLKANPPRLISNINFITRFCNAARLMTGEGGYYFTNLCCAVSFIENLTPESLNMSKEDFNMYMSLPAVVGGGSWVAALSLCEGLHNAQDQLKALKELNEQVATFGNDVKDLNENVQIFKDEILKKVSDLLTRTPLDYKLKKIATYTNPNYEYNRVQMTNEIDSNEMSKIPSTDNSSVNDIVQGIEEHDIFGPCNDDKTEIISTFSGRDKQVELPINKKNYNVKNLLPPNTLANFSIALDNPPMPTLRTIGAGSFMSPSPVFGFDSFDTHSLDELATPDEYGGLSNVNYDIDLSDLSAENSAAEDFPMQLGSKPKAQDPFSPEGLTNSVYETIWYPTPPAAKTTESHLPQLILPILESNEAISILDAADSPTTDCQLPSPIKPLNIPLPTDNKSDK